MAAMTSLLLCALLCLHLGAGAGYRRAGQLRGAGAGSRAAARMLRSTMFQQRQMRSLTHTARCRRLQIMYIFSVNFNRPQSHYSFYLHLLDVIRFKHT